MSIKVAIVEDNKQIREGLASIIDSSAGFQCVAACESAEAAMELLPKKRPDVVLMDVELPGMSGIECIRKLKDETAEMQIMMLTVFDDPDRIFQSLQAGASGYLVKKTPPEKLLTAIRELHAGGSPMTGQIARRVIESFRTPSADAHEVTPREREILDLMVRGFSNKEIAGELGISVETVRTHARHIYEKLHVKSRMGAILKLHPQRFGHGGAEK